MNPEEKLIGKLLAQAWNHDGKIMDLARQAQAALDVHALQFKNLGIMEATNVFMKNQCLTESWPLMRCQTCSHTQTFSSVFVNHGKAMGYCDNCRMGRHWLLVPRKNL